MNPYQEYFISNYVVFNKRDRLIFELNSKKKKEKFMNYFCHDTKKIIIPERIVYEGNVIDAMPYIKSINEFYVMTYDNIEGKMLDKNELMKYIEEEYMPIIAISKSLVIIKEEVEKKGHLYILKENKKN